MSKSIASVVRSLACVSASLLISGCGWYLVKVAPHAMEKQGYTVDLPVGWIQNKYVGDDMVILSRDGYNLQTIVIRHAPLTKAFPRSGKPASADSLPGDLAADFIAEARLANENIEVLETAPAVVAGRPGFRLELGFSTPTGLRYQTRAYGVATPRGFYEIHYKAPVIHYWAKDLETFEAMVATLNFAAAAPAPRRG